MQDAQMLKRQKAKERDKEYKDLLFVKAINQENKKLLTRLVDISRGKYSTIKNGINLNTVMSGQQIHHSFLPPVN